jgi:HlyD family secretion protein
MSEIARVKGQITEIGLQILSVDQKARSEAQNELRDVEGKIADLLERKISAEDMLKRVDLRAPVAGTIHELAVHTVGGVIGPGEPVMLIVPSGDPLAIEVKISPQDVDNVTVGKSAVMRFTAFNQRTSPELKGQVIEVAADLTRDPKTGQGYYVARLRLNDGELANLNGVKLLPGMPVEAFIGQSERTALSYFTKPITDQLSRAMRER